MNKEWLKQWLQKANHDLIASKMILDSHPIILDISCFHCQQAIEKLLKLFLLANNQELIKTHSLDILVEECIDIDKSFSELDFKDLESYAVRSRYPDQFIAPELSEAKEYYQIALAVKELVLSKVEL